MTSYIRGRRAIASRALIDTLRAVGIIASVGYPKRNDGTLEARLRDMSRAAEVPREWHGFRVVCKPGPWAFRVHPDGRIALDEE